MAKEPLPVSSKVLSHRDAFSMVINAFPESRLQYRVASDSWVLDGHSVSSGELSRLIACETDIVPSKVLNLLAKMGWGRREAGAIQLNAWLKDVERRPVSDRALRAWLKLMARKDTDPMMHEANVVAMKQWIWQVKRNIANRPVVWHVVPIFWSKENGTGKSFNLRRLLSPVDKFTRNLDVNELGERFSGRIFAQTLVAFLDEFAGVEKANVSQLKAIVTGKPIDSRSMYSESGFYAANRMSCIATSNLAPPHGFIDTTGARRFWSIHCSNEPMKEGPRRDAFDAIDMDQVWACVAMGEEPPHYTAPTAVLKYMEEVREESLRSKTSLETFCEECLEEAPGERLILSDFKERYKRYCADGSLRPVRGGHKDISAKLKDMDYETVNYSNRYYLKNWRLVDFASDDH